MHGKDFLIDDCGNGKTVETIGECFPQFNVVPTFTYDLAGQGLKTYIHHRIRRFC
jgi:hypothetical protein